MGMSEEEKDEKELKLEGVGSDETVLCAASSYDQKFYLNPLFSKLPQEIKDDLKIVSVMFVEDNGGIFLMKFDRNRKLVMMTEAKESDYNYDDIGVGMSIRAIQKKRTRMLQEITLYYRAVICGETLEQIEKEVEEDFE